MNTDTDNRDTATPLAIVGIGCLFPKADGLGGYWANVKHGVDCITAVPPTHWDPEQYFDPDPKAPDRTYARRGGFLSPVDFNPLEFGIAPRDIEATDTSQLLGLVAAKQALMDAGVVFADQKSEVRSQKSEVRSQKPEVRSQKSESDNASPLTSDLRLLTSDFRPPTSDLRPPTSVVDRDRVSVILGVTGTLELVIPLGARLGHPKWRQAMKDAGIPDDAAEDAAERIAESYVPWQENSFPGLLGNVVAGRIANRLDLGGTNCVVDAACASSLSAVHLAALELAAGRSDVVVTGGVDTFNDIFMFMCFSKTPALSPTGDAKPFDADGDGTALGEGLGVVVLKRLADAERDGDRIYAVIKAIGSSSDGKGTAIYAPNASGQRKAIRTAYQLAGVTPDTIELVEAHGTGTKVGDATEATALTEVFNAVSREAQPSAKVRPWCAVGSVKSQIGHTKAAAGAASLIKAALALHYKVLPPTLKVTKPVEPLRAADSPFYVNTQARPWLPRAEHPRRAALSAFGFGGSNFHAVLEEYRPGKQDVDWDGSVELFAVGAETPRTLAEELDRLINPSPGPSPKRGGGPEGLSPPSLLGKGVGGLGSSALTWRAFARVAEASRAAFRPDAPCRLVLVAHRGHTDLLRLIAAAKAKLAAEPDGAWSTPDGAHYGRGPAPGKLAVLFPGQGSQAVGMLRDLACLFPEVLDSLAAANDAVAAQHGDESDAGRLSDRIYPPTAFDPDAKKRQDAALRATDAAQPAIGAVSYGAWRVLSERFGLEADAFAGHSYGELPALTAAGRLTRADLFALSCLRGRLMAGQSVGDAGTMLAAFAPLAEIEATIAGLNVVVANQNAPAQSVLSGANANIEEAEKALAARGVRTARLPVAAAFHSPLVADAAAPFRAALDGVEFRPGDRPVFANTTAAEYPDGPIAVRDLLGDQLANPVRFAEQIRALAAAGVRTFVEVGPGSVLTRLVEQTLSDAAVPRAEAAALDASSGKRSGVLDLGHLLGRLVARGYAVRLAEWEADSRCRPAAEPTPGMTVPVCGANAVAPRPRRAPRPPSVNGAPVRPAPTDPRATFPAAGMTPMAEPAPPPPGLPQVLHLTQQTLAALQQMQEQTARLHKQFLDSHEQAQKTLFALVAQQQALLDPTAAPAPVAVPTPAPAVVPAPTPPAVTGAVDRVLLEVIAEKTGYPVEMLDLSMALDADLGVDSIKRVEILSALQERLPQAPVVKPEHLGTLHTLQDVADFLAGGTTPDTEPVPVARPATDTVSDILLAVVAEKTGYPAEMLDLSMALDADLGVDSIKRVEILSALQERLPQAPVVKPEHLGTLHTLRDVADFLAADPPPAPIPQRVPARPAESKSAVADLLAEDTVHLGQPSAENDPARTVRLPAPPVIEAETPAAHQPVPPINLDRVDRSILQAVDLDPSNSRLRVMLPEGAEVWLVAADDPLAAALTAALTARGLQVAQLPWADPGTEVPAGSPAALILLAPERPDPAVPLNRLGFRWLQHVGSKLRAVGRAGGALVGSVARLDGAFGLADLNVNTDPTAGGLAGLVKTVKHEWPEVACKALDVAAAFAIADPTAAAAALAEELLLAGPLEVGVSAAGRCALELARTARRSQVGGPPLTRTDVVLVTGGARGVTAEVAVALAEVYQPTLVLTGRTPPPVGPEPEWLRPLTDDAALKKAIADHLGAGATPRAVGEFHARVKAQREIARTLERVNRAGARVAYLSVNAANGRHAAELVARVRDKFGPVTALIHGAGVLADRRIEDLTPEGFDAVYSTKVDGLRNLLDHLPGPDLKTMVLFSSITARHGRAGQLAYACANEVLNKTAQVEARRRPGARVVAINWGPWEGGMVTPALKRVFESEGVGLIPLVEGGLFAVQELSAAGRAVEVLALGKPTRSARSSGVVPASSQTRVPTVGPTPPPATPVSELATAFERTIDIETHPVLRSHVLDGRAVLPMALHVELLAHAALHGNPGLVFHGFNDLRITNGVMVEDGSAVHLRAMAGKAVKRDQAFHVPVELRGKRRDGRDAIHSRAEVVLAATHPRPPAADPPPPVQPYPHPIDEVYRYFLFHGRALHGIERVDGLSETAFIGTATPAPPPADWLKSPLRSAWVADPLVLDASFQMMILWSFAQHGAGSLPCFAGRYRQYRRAYPAGPVRVVVRVTKDNGQFARADVDYLDAAGQVIARVQDYECVIDRQLDQAFRKNQLAPRVKT
ncbi:MAG TPA: SDR family NAD(P)-dependent oxidoreductase [Fimbriiglobus sp.]|nr:SDR family NAD(P)-dependent oxidoreductase [Fimbriiglobus sp.]